MLVALELDEEEQLLHTGSTWVDEGFVVVDTDDTHLIVFSKKEQVTHRKPRAEVRRKGVHPGGAFRTPAQVGLFADRSTDRPIGPVADKGLLESGASSSGRSARRRDYSW